MSMKWIVRRMVWHVTAELWLFLRRIQNTYTRTNGLSFMMADFIRVGHDIASRVNADQRFTFT
jgi:hypothetical protein